MTLKEREQTVKDLQKVVDSYSGSWKRYDVLAKALVLIKELTEEIKDLETDYDRVYEQAEADIHGNIADGGTSCHWCIDKTKADTVKRMRERFEERLDISVCGYSTEEVVSNVLETLDMVAEETLEEIR